MTTILRKKLRDFKKDPFFYLILAAIVGLAIFFRFYNYFDRVSTLSDNSLAVAVARYGADNLKIPLIGQFSSAGPFFYGPWYYILLELVSFVPLGFLTHWYFISGVYLLFIYLVFLVGKEIGGRWVGILSSLLAVISTAQTEFSFSVWSPTIIPILSVASLLFLVRFAKYQKPWNIFLLSITVSLAITIHFQSILLAPTLLVALVTARPTFASLLRLVPYVALGLVIPLVPLVYFDLRFDWYNFKNIIIYLLVDQYKIWIPNRWLTYLGSYWPEAWAYIVGGKWQVAVVLALLFFSFFITKLPSVKKLKLFYLVAIVFLLEIVMFRYFRGERFLYYSLFAHGAVIVLSAWTMVQLFTFNKVLAISFLILVLTTTISRTFLNLRDRGVTIGRINSVKEEIYNKYPNSTFDIYGCHLNPNAISYPIALSMYVDGRNSPGGLKVSVCELSGVLSWINIDREYERDWRGKVFNRSVETVYRDTAEWWHRNPPARGEGDFWRFILENSPIFSAGGRF